MRYLRPVGAALGIVAVLAACGSDDDATSDTTPATDAPAPTAATEPAATPAGSTAPAESTAPADVVDLAAVCPDPIVVQTDWYPSPEHGYLYSMIGDGGTVDTANGVFRGPLLGANVELEIRSGGPYLGYQSTSAIMYQDPGVLLGFDSTDSQIQQSGEFPTKSVMAPFTKNPQVLMWDPAEHDFASFDEIGESGATVLYYQGAAFIDYLVATGALDTDQLDGGYDGAPARFVADPTIVQQGFATSEPYNYAHVIEGYQRPVDYLVVADAGFDIYSQTLAARPEVVTEEADCFAALVPMVQRAEVAFYADPEPTNALILDIVEQLDTAWQLDPGLMEYSWETTLDGEFVANGADGVLGSLDPERMARLVDTLSELFAGQANMAADLDPTSLYTNEFLDTSIALPAG